MNKKHIILTKKDITAARTAATTILINTGMMYGKSRMFTDSTVIRKCGGLSNQYYARAPKYGERAWIAYGKKRDLILWDCGNGWYQLVKEFEHDERKKGFGVPKYCLGL